MQEIEFLEQNRLSEGNLTFFKLYMYILENYTKTRYNKMNERRLLWIVFGI